MIRFEIESNNLIMKYSSNSPINWIKDNLKTNNQSIIAKTQFHRLVIMRNLIIEISDT